MMYELNEPKGMTSMVAPLLSYVTFNRLGLTEKSISSILKTSDDFEMHIVDNNSTDGSWKYIQSLKDSRIKSRTRLPVNLGQVYALNLNLTKRREDQYFISVDNDVVIDTTDWITRFMNIFNAFPQIGLLGVQASSPNTDNLPSTPIFEKGLLYWKLSKTYNAEGFKPGCCLCLKPELINDIGYYSEENGFGNTELLFRINYCTSYKVGIMTDISVSKLQTIDCSECGYKDRCKLSSSTKTCFAIYQRLYKNDLFLEQFRWKFEETKKDLLSGARPVYCASLFSYNSTDEEIFNLDWATENFQFFIDKAN